MGKNEDMEFSERSKMRKEQSGQNRQWARSNPKQIPNPNVEIPNQPRYLVWNLRFEICLGFDA
jgi:hypothetical protein